MRGSGIAGGWLPMRWVVSFPRRSPSGCRVAGRLHAQKRPTSVSLLDIAGFSAFAAHASPKDVIARLDDVLSACADVVAETGGVVISYTGDGLLASYSNPVASKVPQKAALDASQDIIAAVVSRNFQCRIGLAHGPVVVGRIGSRSREAFTAYGETVNIVARLETLSKEHGGGILADAPFRHGGNSDAWRSLGSVDLRAVGVPVDAFAFTGGRQESSVTS